MSQVLTRKAIYWNTNLNKSTNKTSYLSIGFLWLIYYNSWHSLTNKKKIKTSKAIASFLRNNTRTITAKQQLSFFKVDEIHWHRREFGFYPKRCKTPFPTEGKKNYSLSNYGQTNVYLKCTYLIKVFFILFDYYATLQALLLSPAEIAKTRKR